MGSEYQDRSGRGNLQTTVEGPDALIENYACHEKAICSLILECPPAWMTIANFVQDQKVAPTI